MDDDATMWILPTDTFFVITDNVYVRSMSIALISHFTIYSPKKKVQKSQGFLFQHDAEPRNSRKGSLLGVQECLSKDRSVCDGAVAVRWVPEGRLVAASGAGGM